MRIRASLAVFATAVAAAGVIGGVTAVALIGSSGQRQEQQIVRDVSETSMLEDSSPTPTVEPAETQASDPADVPTPEATTREQKAAKTETQDSEPTTTPEPPDTGGDGTEPVPDPGPPLPTMKRCFNEHGEIPCSYASS